MKVGRKVAEDVSIEPERLGDYLRLVDILRITQLFEPVEPARLWFPRSRQRRRFARPTRSSRRGVQEPRQRVQQWPRGRTAGASTASAAGGDPCLTASHGRCRAAKCRAFQD